MNASVTQFLYNFIRFCTIFHAFINYLRSLEKVNSILIIYNGSNYIRNLFCIAIMCARFLQCSQCLFFFVIKRWLTSINQFLDLDLTRRDRGEQRSYRESIKITDRQTGRNFGRSRRYDRRRYLIMLMHYPPSVVFPNEISKYFRAMARHARRTLADHFCSVALHDRNEL